ncbi:MAG: caspase family protein [Burkholderiaceae bacterium]|nr:caspase family protein [Burkholderiaceae bacterium]
MPTTSGLSSHHIVLRALAALMMGLLLMGCAHAASIARPTDLREDRYLDAAVVARLKAGAQVDILAFEGGWVEVRTKQNNGWVRAMFLKGDGARKAQSAALESGRSNKLQAVSTTGIRSIARASRHALIIGVGEYSRPGISSLKGVKHDIKSAAQIARTMGVAPENITYLRDTDATAQNIRLAFRSMEKRMRQGDRAFVYYSGHGTRWPDTSFDSNACTEGLLATDGQALTNREISRLLMPISRKAEKLMVFYDACHSGGLANQPLRTRSLATSGGQLMPKFAGEVSPERCATPSNMKTRSLSGELGRMGAVPSNTVFIAASRPDEVSFDDPRSGGLATVAWRDCLLGKAADLDGSGAITVDETTQCAQIGLDERLQGQPDILGQKMTIGGNRQFVIGAPGASASEAQLAEQRLAAARAQEEQEREREKQEREKEKERQRVAAQQAVELARAEALAQEKERERVAAEQAAAQALAAAEAQAQAEKDRLAAQALAQAQERQRVAAQQALEMAKAQEEAKEKAEQERLEAAMQAQAEARARLAAEQAAAAAKAKAEAERARLAAEALAQEKERERVAAEQAAAQALAAAEAQAQAEKDRLVAQALAQEQERERVAAQQALELAKAQEEAKEKAEQERIEVAMQAQALAKEQQAQQQEQERLEAALQATTQGTAAPPPTNSNVTTLASVDDGAISMQPALPLPATTQAKPAALLVEMFQQRDATRVLSVEANQKILKIDKDPLELTITSPTDGYLYVALAGSDQESLYLLFPNQIDANNQIKANVPVKLPRRSWRIVAGGPKGTDTVLVIVTDSPRDLSQLDGEDAGLFVMPLQTREGRSQLQALIGASGNADQQVCQTGGKTRNLKVQIVCSDAYAAKLIEFEER